jgi:hypothetical protein
MLVIQVVANLAFLLQLSVRRYDKPFAGLLGAGSGLVYQPTRRVAK